MKEKKLLQRLLACALCLAMLASFIAMPASATEETAADTPAAQSAEEPLDVLWMASDFQKNATANLNCTYASQAALQPIVDAMVNNGVDKVTGAIFLGDYAPGYYNLDNTNLGIQAIRGVLKNAWGIDYENILFMQGNHEADYQAYWDHGNDPAYYQVVSGVYSLASGGKHDAENYGVYIINEVDYSWDNIGGVEKVTKTAAALESYLKTKVNQSYDKPIFITSHLPLNFSERTIHSGDAFTGELLFNVINKYAAKGLNIIYLYGHDHNHGFSNYLGGDAVYLTKGDTMLLADTDDTARNTYYVSEPMHFTYLNGGFLGEINGCCEGAKAGVSNENTATIFEIYEDRVEITRYNANGVYNMKNAGANSQCSCSNGIYCDETYAPNTKVLSGTQTVTMNKAAYSLELGELASGLMVAGETATVYLQVRDGNTYDVDWVSSDPEVVSVAGNGTEALVTALRPGSVMVTVTPTLSTTRAAAQLSFQLTVISDVQNPGELITVVTRGETIYMRQPYQWDNPFVYDYWPYFSTADDNPFLLVREQTGYTETYGNRVFLGQTSAYGSVYPYDNEGISAQAMGYVFHGFEHPFIKASSVPSDRFCWMITKKETGISGFGTPFTIRNVSSGNHLYLTAGDGEQYGQENYGFRFKGDDVGSEYGGTWWRMTSGTTDYNSDGLLGLKGTADSYTSHTFYYSSSRNHFATSTGSGLYYRVYLYHQTTAPVTVTVQLSDTMGYICKDAPIKISTGDYITLTEGDKVTQIPLTVEMLEGYVDRNTAGTYSDLKVVYQGVTLTEDYTLVVRDSASLMVNDGSDSATSSIYRLATGITEGKKYMIVNSNQPGQAQALGFVSQNDGSSVDETETESYYVVVEEWTIDGVTDLYVDASNFNGVDHISGHRMAWFAQKTFNYTTSDGVAGSATSLDAYYYFVSVNTPQYALLNGRSVTSSFEPYNYRWGADYDTYGLYNNYESDNTGAPKYLNYDAGLLEINKFTVREGNVDSRIYLYEQVPSFALAAGYMSDLEGKVTTQAVGSTITGDALIIETMSIDGTMDTAAIPVTISMLNATKEQLTTPGTYYNLTVTYHGQVITDDYTLVVEDVVLDDYPDYPEEGSVKIDKTLDQSKYTYLATGAASIDLTVTGVPQFSGADVVIVLDTSSSMAFGIDGNEVETEKSRLMLLQESLKRLMLNLQTDVNGEPQDISISIVDFNGYTPIDNTHTPHQFPYTNTFNRTTISGHSPAGFTNRDVSEVYLPFTDIADMTEAEIDSVLSQITYKSGTNYDRGLQWAYDLLYEKQAQNSLAGEYRHPYVVFMSDGCPFQYNYIVCDGDGVFWEDYLLGHLEEAVAGQTEASREPHFLATGIQYSSVAEMFSQPAADVWEDFYNPDGKHWMAEAIKGDPNTKYKVIDPDIGNVDDDFVTEVNGLGATMVTIGLGIYYSGEMEEDDCKEVLRSIATNPENYYDVYSAEDLDNAFDDFASLVATADGAAYTDQMSEEFEVLTYNQRTFEKIDGSSVTVTYNPSITLRQNPLYMHSEIGKTLSFTDSDGQAVEVRVTEDMVGTPKPEDSVLLETVIFNDDGTAAYSTKVDLDGDGIFGATIQADGSCIVTDEEDNIFIDNVIYAKEFCYNASTEETKTVRPNGSATDVQLTPKTFRWNVGIIPQNELVLTYDIYLTGSMEGTRPAGQYDTNSHAELDYVNYLDHDCQLIAPVPILLWGQASVGYGFYLVNSNGQPVTDGKNYEVCGFEEALKVGTLGYDFFYLNAEEQTFTASDKYILQALESKGYILYDLGAGYAVSTDSEGGGYYTVTTAEGNEIPTTYVEGVQNNAVSSIGKTETADYSSANTIVWFAVRLKPCSKPDAVVVDFGLPIDIHVLVNDVLEYGGELLGIGAVPESLEETSQPKDGFGQDYSGGFGSAVVEGDKVIYTPGTMQMSYKDVFAYAVKYVDGNTIRYFYDTVTVVPATSIYYEDDFVDFTGTWETAGEYQGDNQGEDRPGEFEFPNYDADNIYGYDSAYDNSTTYSLGSARYAHVNSKTFETDGAWPTAKFTFTGTGFDLISLTSNQTGFITCRVYKGIQTETIYESWVVDTYYGYSRSIDKDYPWVEYTWTYNGERWTATKTCVAEKTKEESTELPTKPNTGDVVILYKENYIWTPVDSDTSNDLYQIPVIKSPELDYGIYTVVITPTYIPFFDHTGSGGYDFYLDAVRIYAPAENMEDYYLQDGEAYPQYVELRKQLLTTDEAGNATGYVNGISFIDGVEEGLLADYDAYDPNNEIYLNSNQAIAFAIDSKGQSIANVHVGVKIFDNPGTLTAAAINAAGETLAEQTVTTTSHTDLYYSISSTYIPVEGENISNVIVLTNTGSSPITLTTLKITYSEAPTADSELVMDLEKMQAAAGYVGRKVSIDLPMSKDLPLTMGHSVNFESDLQMNYRIKREALEGYDLSTAYLVVEKDVYSTKGEMAVETYTLYPDLTSDAERVIFTLKGIQSVEMGSELRATLYISDNQGREVKSNVDIYSILAYAQLCFDSYSYEEQPALYRLLMDTLNYGAAAQLYFGRRTDGLVNAGMEAYQQYATDELAAELTDTKVVTDNSNSTMVSKLGFTVSFADRLELNARLTLSGKAAEITSVKVTDESGKTVATLTEFTQLPDGRLQVTYSGIKATQLRNMYYFTAYSGETAVSPTTGYSVEAYARSCLNSSDFALAALVRSCMYYGDSATDYFNEKGGESN